MNDVAWALNTARQVGPVAPPHAHAHPIHKAHLLHTGPLRSHVAGRTDHLPSQVPNGSFVLPADIVSGLGEGNTEAGFKTAKRMFEGAHREFGGLPYAGDNGPYGQGGGLPYAIVKGHASGGSVEWNQTPNSGTATHPVLQKRGFEPGRSLPHSGGAYHFANNEGDNFVVKKDGSWAYSGPSGKRSGDDAAALDDFYKSKADGGTVADSSTVEPVAHNGLVAGSIPAPPTIEGIMAYHGSPHQFDQFDASKIGTGEGAQAYGHGLYFAQNEGVAKQYRDALNDRRFVDKQSNPLDTATSGALEYVSPRFKASGDMAGGVQDAIDRMRDQAEFYRRTYGPGYNLYDSALERLQAVNPDNIKPAGHMYQVRINAHPDHFLDWDKSLPKQSQHVKDALDRMGVRERMPNAGGQAIWQALADEGPMNGRENRATAALHGAGIRGIRYLDQGSRGQGEGTHNYVVFDPRDIQIMRRYAQGGDVAADQQAVPVAVAGGEHVLAPHEVAFAGMGDQEAGHKALEAFVLRQRAKLIKTLKGLPGPSRD